MLVMVEGWDGLLAVWKEDDDLSEGKEDGDLSGADDAAAVDV